MIKLGQKVRCKITGFKGTAIARTEWINGCARVTLQPKVDKDGKPVDAHTFDEPQLEVLEESTYQPVENEKTGGPMDLKVEQRPGPSRL